MNKLCLLITVASLIAQGHQKQAKQQQQAACPYEEFQCLSDGDCIPDDWRCDQSDDCQDGSDELDCPTKGPPASCDAGEYTCGNGHCIPFYWQCDNYGDCADGSDEVNCPAPTKGPPEPCESDEYTCADGFCIPDYNKCDDYYDCTGGDDELNCPCNGYRCDNGQCVGKGNSSVCNGKVECYDASDERNCNCDHTQFDCGLCIPGKFQCDHIVDCPDGSDEENCNYTLPHSPEAEKKLIKLQQDDNNRLHKRHPNPSYKIIQAKQISIRDAKRRMRMNRIKQRQNIKREQVIFLPIRSRNSI